jgi:hypothetical protein
VGLLAAKRRRHAGRAGVLDRCAWESFALTVSVAVLGCHPTPANVPEVAVTLVTDSTEYHATFVGGLYRAAIGYVYTNHTSASVSASYCHTPTPPALEKSVGGQWVLAYSPVVLLCETIPPFQILGGASYRGTLHFAAAPPGRRMGPVLYVDSLPGVYRLRWALRAGADPKLEGAAVVEAISNQFSLAER